MQDYSSFASVYRFFLECHFNRQYIRLIDTAIDRETIDVETKRLISTVQAFHNMRQQLCSRIYGVIENDELLKKLVSSKGLEQYDVVPVNSTCQISGAQLQPHSGILLVIFGENMSSITVHKRYKRVLYNFYYLVHFTKEITLEVDNWLKKQKNVTATIEQIVHYQDSVFVKKSYVKIKNIGQYIQTELAELPINLQTKKE